MAPYQHTIVSRAEWASWMDDFRRLTERGHRARACLLAGLPRWTDPEGWTWFPLWDGARLAFRPDLLAPLGVPREPTGGTFPWPTPAAAMAATEILAPPPALPSAWPRRPAPYGCSSAPATRNGRPGLSPAARPAFAAPVAVDALWTPPATPAPVLPPAPPPPPLAPVPARLPPARPPPALPPSASAARPTRPQSARLHRDLSDLGL